MAEVFRDGEPVDPDKLRKLQAQITELKATANNAFDLANRTADGTTETFQYITRADSIEFNNLKNGTKYEQGTDPGFIDGDIVYTTATPRYVRPEFYKVNVSVSGSRLAPTINVSQTNADKKTMERLVVDYISVAKRKIETP